MKPAALQLRVQRAQHGLAQQWQIEAAVAEADETIGLVEIAGSGAAQLVGAVKKRPLKGRRLAQHLAGTPLEAGLHEYVATRAASRALIVNIESVPAPEALDEILAVEGLDGVLVGPHDLSTSLGVPEQYDHPKFLAACDTIIAKARARSRGAGVHAIYPAKRLAHEERWARLGANFNLHAADILLFAEGIRRDLGELKARLGDSPAGSGPSINL